VNLFVTFICLSEAESEKLSARDREALRQAVPGAVLLFPAEIQAWTQAQQQAAAAVRRAAQRSADWTAGLKARTANALRAHGLTSRQQVARLSRRRLRSIPNIGADSLEDIRRWLGR
jgi:ERCC4-type nuclease